MELRRGARWARDDFVETPAALRKRVESLDAFGTVRRTEDATPASFAAETTTDGGRMTEEFDRKRALTPYYGEMRGERVACGVVQTPETESVGEAMRRETRRRAEASEGYGARGAVLGVVLVVFWLLLLLLWLLLGYLSRTGVPSLATLARLLLPSSWLLLSAWLASFSSLLSPFSLALLKV